ncbi:MAG: MOSC domain-containing protein [Paenibacillaceae bacterium]|uniref:MOSC domain-containing protein n=1 Tax=Paenibacillus mellifer TaxID=2937794 RepID=A0A9X1XYR1_9BACL|nr:MOSC domain-containing protein [Paenibacillus mellifer]MBW4838120.1 MOSC domain-containing protein [Paenibacillaceae bacterium]MCK8487261.1 MOSC domain-containing protein [Paenibacillus mellifer]
MAEQIAIRSLNVSKPIEVEHQGKTVRTGIFKMPVKETLHLSTVNFIGDEQADLRFHGGPDKAVCVYPFERYSYWEERFGITLDFGAFGENLTTEGMLEEEIRIGDRFRLGEAVVQVSQPRQPCFKLGVKHGLPELQLEIQQTGYTGYYFRVLREGEVRPDDPLELIDRHPAGVTLAFANRIMHVDKEDADGIRRLLAVEELSANWRETLTARLSRLIGE